MACCCLRNAVGSAGRSPPPPHPPPPPPDLADDDDETDTSAVKSVALVVPVASEPELPDEDKPPTPLRCRAFSRTKATDCSIEKAPLLLPSTFSEPFPLSPGPSPCADADDASETSSSSSSSLSPSSSCSSSSSSSSSSPASSSMWSLTPMAPSDMFSSWKAARRVGPRFGARWDPCRERVCEGVVRGCVEKGGC